jgi:hypothetical protein
MSNSGTIPTGDVRKAWMNDHVATYMWSGGIEGHVVDLRGIGGHRFTTTLLLKSVEGGAGKPVLTPLIYGNIGGEVAVTVWRSAEGVQAEWYQTIATAELVDFQVGAQAFRARWRLAEEEERARIWPHMVAIFPPNAQSLASSTEPIAILLLSPIESITPFHQ